MTARRLNSIATRIAATIILAVVLGFALQVALAEALVYIAPKLEDQPGHSSLHVIVSRQTIFIIDLERNLPMLSSKVATIARLVETAPAAERERIVGTLSQPALQVALRDAPVPGSKRDGEDGLLALRRLTELQLASPSPRVVVATVPAAASDGAGAPQTGAAAPRRTRALLIQVALPDGRWLAMTVPDYAPDEVRLARIALILAPFLGLVALLSIWTAGRLAAPIRDFAAAAERLGVDSSAPPLIERGPYELRAAIRAFNRMQERLRRFLDDRTQMLAAMSHDLRTPLARLRLRAEFVEDGEQQRRMFGDLEAMNTMIDSTLAFVRDDRQQEKRRLVDLGVLVEDVCEDVSDAGGNASYSGPRGINVYCRPAAIRRAVTNLIDNALKYGGAARIRLARDGDCVTVTVEDDGPGIPAAERERVFTPFFRLEGSRNPDTGGVGLGLSVARTIAREHGGDITLAEAEGGGLSARLELPSPAQR